MSASRLAWLTMLALLGLTEARANCPVVANNPESTPDARFLRSEAVAGGPVVEDLVSGLIWQGCESGFGGTGCETGSAALVDWTGALQLADASAYAGFLDWRLPSARELQTLIETACSGPTLNTSLFPVDTGAELWTSTGLAQPDAGLYPRAWWVSFASGERRAGLKSELRRVRLVRAGRGLSAFDSGGDFVPDSVSLAVQRAVPRGQVIEFGPLTVSGIDTPIGVSVQGGGEPQYAVNGAAFVSAPGIVQDGDLLRVRHTSASQAAYPVTTRVRIGGIEVEAQSVTASDDASLAALALDVASLQPAFSTAQLSYEAAVGNAVSSARITASPADPAASLRIAGSPALAGQPSNPLALAPGANLYVVAVLAEDGVTELEYSVRIDRALAASSTILASSAASTLPGAALTLTATVQGDAPGGTVAFLANGSGIAGCAARPLSAGSPHSAVCTTSDLPPGQVTLRAEYAGDPANLPSSAEISHTVNTPPELSIAAVVEVDEDGQVQLAFGLSDAESDAAQLSLDLSVSPDELLDRDDLIASLAGEGATRTLTIRPRADAFGSGTLALRASDPQGGEVEVLVAVNVLAVNDPPSANVPRRLVHAQGSVGSRRVVGFADGLSVGPANESAQQLSFSVRRVSDVDGVVDALSLSAAGDLDYTLTGRPGVARFELVPVDDGGRLRGGQDEGPASLLRVFVGAGSDLETTLERVLPLGSDLPGLVSGGVSSGEYLLRVRNHGPDDLQALSVRVDAQRGLANLLWQCVPPAACVPGEGSGRVRTGLALAADEELRLGLSGDFLPGQFHLVLDAWAVAAEGLLVGKEDDRYVLVEALHPEAIFYSGME